MTTSVRSTGLHQMPCSLAVREQHASWRSDHVAIACTDIYAPFAQVYSYHLSAAALRVGTDAYFLQPDLWYLAGPSGSSIVHSNASSGKSTCG